MFRADPVCASLLIVKSELTRRIAATMAADALAWDFYVTLASAGLGDITRDSGALAEYRASEAAVHTQPGKLAGSTTEVRAAAMADYPELEALVGGSGKARRSIALATLTEALRRLEVGQLREFAWHSLVALRQRQLRPVVWVLIHAANRLYGRGLMSG